MDEIDEALKSLADRYSAPAPGIERIVARSLGRGLLSHARRSIPVTLGLLLVITAFGLGAAAASLNRGSSVTYREHDFVPLSTSATCAPERATVTVSSRSGQTGSVVKVSGPLYYLNSDNEVWVPGNDEIQAWWNLDPSEYASAADSAVRAANGGDAKVAPSGAELVGQYQPQGACSFDLRFTVPNAPPGKYPVSIVAVAGSDGSTTVYGSFFYEIA
jgi:hypothetical protein